MLIYLFFINFNLILILFKFLNILNIYTNAIIIRKNIRSLKRKKFLFKKLINYRSEIIKNFFILTGMQRINYN